MTRPLAAASIALLAALAAPARAADDPLLPPTAADLTGVRSAALAASRGLAGGNEAIFLNAASLAARRRYSLETQWLLERNGGTDAGQSITTSAVDSETGSVAGGFAYTRIASGPSVGNAYHLALATRVGGPLFAGVTGKYLSLGGTRAGGALAEDVRAATMDASLFLALGKLSAGFSGYNLVDVGHPQQAPKGFGAGLAIGDDRSFHLTGDWRVDLDRRGRRTNAWAAGAEMLVGDAVPVRVGFLKDDTRDVRWWSAGLGLVSTTGAALDLTYRQSARDSSDRLFGVALKLFLLTG